MKRAVLAMMLATGFGAGGCAHAQHLSNRQVAIGIGVVVVAGVVIFAMTQSSDNDSFGFNH